MDRAPAHPLPARDPIAGGPLVITELEAVESGVTIRGRFEVPRFARLSPDQARYLETFLRCRGMLNSVEKELGISYPTARARLDAVLKALGLHAVREDVPPTASVVEEGIVEEETLDVAPSEYESPEVEIPTWEPSEEEEEAAAFDLPPEEASTVGEELSAPVEPEAPRRTRAEILTMLERGEISVDEVKKELERAR